MDIPATLAGGDRRSIGLSNEVVAHILKHRASLEALMDAIDCDDPVVRMRATDAAEKIAAKRPEWMARRADRLIRIAEASCQQEVRWHMAQIFARLDLTPDQTRAATEIMFRYLNDDSRIVRVSAITALASFASNDVRLRAKVMPLIEEMAKTGSPAERARARKLSP
jgi:hypothetical protein